MTSRDRSKCRAALDGDCVAAELMTDAVARALESPAERRELGRGLTRPGPMTATFAVAVAKRGFADLRQPEVGGTLLQLRRQVRARVRLQLPWYVCREGPCAIRDEEQGLRPTR